MRIRKRAKRALQSLSLSQGGLRGFARLARVLRETKVVSLRMTNLRGYCMGKRAWQAP
jgi:hypothetical protein